MSGAAGDADEAAPAVREEHREGASGAMPLELMHARRGLPPYLQDACEVRVIDHAAAPSGCKERASMLDGSPRFGGKEEARRH
jgi:hypothetical protein